MENNNKKITNLAVQRGIAASETHEGGSMTFHGPDGVNLYRLITIKHGLRAELKGMRLTRRGPSCFTIARKEFGLKGNKEKIYADFCDLHGFDK